MNNNFDDVRITTLLNTKNERLFFSCFFFDVSMFCVFHVSALHRESIWLYIFTVLLCHSAYSLWICWALLFVIKMCGWFFYYFRVDCVVLLVWLLLVAFRVFSLHLIHSIHVWFINNVCVFVYTILDRVHALNSFILCPQYTVHTYTMMEKKKKKNVIFVWQRASNSNGAYNNTIISMIFIAIHCYSLIFVHFILI